MYMYLHYQVSYTFKLNVDKVTGDILNSHYECPAGRGPHSTCKLVAAVAFMLSKSASGDKIYVDKSCTENLQVFHKPRYSYSGKYVLLATELICAINQTYTLTIPAHF